MKLSEMQAIGQRGRELKQAQKSLEDAERDVRLLAKAATKREDWGVARSWNPTLILRTGERYGHPEISVQIEIPFGVAQQQLANRVREIKREILRLEALPAEETAA